MTTFDNLCVHVKIIFGDLYRDSRLSFTSVLLNSFRYFYRTLSGLRHLTLNSVKIGKEDGRVIHPLRRDLTMLFLVSLERGVLRTTSRKKGLLCSEILKRMSKIDEHPTLFRSLEVNFNP